MRSAIHSLVFLCVLAVDSQTFTAYTKNILTYRKGCAFMALTQTIWSLDDKAPLPAANLKSEKELEDLLAEHIEILNADWLLIGRQVRTVVGKYIDLLCMDHEGDLIVVELKRDLTPREVTAQAIDYASCVADMKLEEFADLYLHTSNGALTLNDAYQKKFGRPLDEESINQNVKMVIVAAKMDDSTERIIRYLREKYEVDINQHLIF